MKKIILLLSFFSVFVVACTNEKGDVAQPVVIKKNIITINDDFFSPASITIVAGDTISWIYPTGASVHTSTCNASTTGTVFPSGGTTWDSGVLSPSPSNVFKVGITVPGNYTYICTVHGVMMSGTIIVSP